MLNKLSIVFFTVHMVLVFPLAGIPGSGFKRLKHTSAPKALSYRSARLDTLLFLISSHSDDMHPVLRKALTQADRRLLAEFMHDQQWHNSSVKKIVCIFSHLYAVFVQYKSEHGTHMKVAERQLLHCFEIISYHLSFQKYLSFYNFLDRNIGYIVLAFSGLPLFFLGGAIGLGFLFGDDDASTEHEQRNDWPEEQLVPYSMGYSSKNEQRYDKKAALPDTEYHHNFKIELRRQLLKYVFYDASYKARQDKLNAHVDNVIADAYVRILGLRRGTQVSTKVG